VCGVSGRQVQSSRLHCTCERYLSHQYCLCQARMGCSSTYSRCRCTLCTGGRLVPGCLYISNFSSASRQFVHTDCFSYFVRTTGGTCCCCTQLVSTCTPEVHLARGKMRGRGKRYPLSFSGCVGGRLLASLTLQVLHFPETKEVNLLGLTAVGPLVPMLTNANEKRSLFPLLLAFDNAAVCLERKGTHFCYIGRHREVRSQVPFFHE